MYTRPAPHIDRLNIAMDENERNVFFYHEYIDQPINIDMSR